MPWNAEHTNPPGGLEKYYRDNVIGGPGSFVMVAEDFQSFGKRHRQEDDRRDRHAAVAPRIVSCAECCPLRTIAVFAALR